ncbi:MAG: hypothetical protein LBG65_00445, partial [Puniceicoccales bacterium]|nr:hypothetical protein [Puniceicoccales bacterium]
MPLPRLVATLTPVLTFAFANALLWFSFGVRFTSSGAYHFDSVGTLFSATAIIGHFGLLALLLLFLPLTLAVLLPILGGGGGDECPYHFTLHKKDPNPCGRQFFFRPVKP